MSLWNWLLKDYFISCHPVSSPLRRKSAPNEFIYYNIRSFHSENSITLQMAQCSQRSPRNNDLTQNMRKVALPTRKNKKIVLLNEQRGKRKIWIDPTNWGSRGSKHYSLPTFLSQKSEKMANGRVRLFWTKERKSGWSGMANSGKREQRKRKTKTVI